MTSFAVVGEYGPARDSTRTLREETMWPEHAAFMNGLVAEGLILLGGPLGDGVRVLLIADGDALAPDAHTRLGLALTREVIDPIGRLGKTESWSTDATDQEAQAMAVNRHDESGGQPSQDQAAALLAAMPFSAWCGIVVGEAGADAVTGSLAWTPERCTSGGVMHGGAIMALADSVGAMCAFLNLPAGASTSTIESKTNFFRAVRSGVVRAVARPLHVGRTVIVIQTDLHDERDRRVAQVTQSQVVLT